MFRGKQEVLHDINFNVRAGEKVAILGPNGAGKSSLLQVLAGHYPSGGQVTLAGHALSEYSKNELAQRIAMVHQQEPAYQNQRVIDLLRLGLLPKNRYQFWDSKADRRRIMTALEQFQLLPLAERPVATLSGGEKQRVQLARAVVQNTEIVLLDEPTSYLDVNYQHEVMAYIQRLDKTVIVTLHDINLALRYCSRLILIDKGHIIFDGSSEDLPESKALEKVYRLPLRFWHGTQHNQLADQNSKNQREQTTLQVEFLRDDQ